MARSKRSVAALSISIRPRRRPLLPVWRYRNVFRASAAAVMLLQRNLLHTAVTRARDTALTHGVAHTDAAATAPRDRTPVANSPWAGGTWQTLVGHDSIPLGLLAGSIRSHDTP